MNRIIKTLVLGMLCLFIASAEEELISPFAAPATELEFNQATPENFPFSSFLFPRDSGDQVVSFKEFGKFRFCKNDLNDDGKEEWIVVLKEEYPHGDEKVYYFAVRDSKLVLILRTNDYFTIIPREETYADMESWHKNAMFSNRQRWTYDPKAGLYVRVWVEFYRDDVIQETIFDRPADTGQPATRPDSNSEGSDKSEPEKNSR